MKQFDTSRKHRSAAVRCLVLLLCAAMVLPLSACGEAEMAQKQVFAMDTVMTLTAYGKNRDAGLQAAQSVILSMDAALDPEVPTSTVYAINHANGSSVVVSAQIAKMLSTAQTVYKQSGGALDPTIYPLIKRWGFIDGKYYLPSDEEISAEMLKMCFDQMVLTSFPTSGGYSVSFPSWAEIGLGAVAKGCASENAVDAMRQAGVTSGIVSLGGNVQTLGLKPDGTRWKVAVQDPNNTASYLGVINVGETAVITSGSYQRNFVASNGRTYHHILNPQTGYPVTNSLLSVTIICEDGTLADCLSTAMFVLGETKALNYWRTYGGFDMVMVTSDKRIICTKGLIEEFTQTNESYKLSFSE
ncbi:MAG: FAD:protein FMN transferase [Oscillospiraceae bacterium]|nr:FAD:protein FMN transferase [Oscillospiraceae bacterium]